VREEEKWLIKINDRTYRIGGHHIRSALTRAILRYLRESRIRFPGIAKLEIIVSKKLDREEKPNEQKEEEGNNYILSHAR